MKLNSFIDSLIKLQQQNPGAGELEVYYRIGSSGDCGPLSSADITDEIDDQCGPFDLADGEKYISIYAGN